MVAAATSRAGSAKAAAKKTAATKAAAAAASKGPAKRTAKTAAKTVASKPVKVAPVEEVEEEEGELAGVFLDGLPARNRHFFLNADLHAKASARATKEGVALAEVLRVGIKEYIATTPAAAKRVDPSDDLAPLGVRGLRAVYKTGDPVMISGYMAALAREGWTLQQIADGCVTAKVAPKMSRQAVSQRVHKADKELPEGLPEVPKTGIRRLHAGLKAFPLPKGRQSPKKVPTRNFAFRITVQDYEAMALRAAYERSMISAVLDDILARYVRGKLKLPKA